MAILEEPKATWDKRYKQKHYGYRDCHRVTTTLNTEAGALSQLLLALAQAQTPPATIYYVFGANAKLKTNPLTGQLYGKTNWPDNCYAREVMVHCTEDAWISIVSINPEYQKQAILQALAQITPTAPSLIFEEPQFVLADSILTFYPTLGYAIIFWYEAGGVAGTLTLWCEGNVEGTE